MTTKAAHGRDRAGLGRPRGRPPASNSLHTRQRIVDVARACFASSGYGATTNKDIASAAHITAAAIYHYFESKRGLYLAVFEAVEARVFDRLRAAGDEGDGFLDKLDRVLDEAVALNRDDPSLTAFFVAVPVEAQRHRELAGLDRRQGIDAAHFFGALVREGMASGEVRADVDAGEVTNVLMAVTSGLARYSSLVGDVDAHARTTRMLARILRGNVFRAPGDLAFGDAQAAPLRRRRLRT